MEKPLSSLLGLFEYTALSADGITPLEYDGEALGDTPVSGISYNSREVEKNHLFFALPGIHQNGNSFIADAVERGASVVIYQDSDENSGSVAAGGNGRGSENDRAYSAEQTISHDDRLKIAKAVLRRSFDNIQDPTQKTSDLVLPVFLKVPDAKAIMARVSAEFYGNPSSRLVVIGVTGTEGKSSTVSFIWQLLRAAGKKAGFISTVEYSLGGEARQNPQHATTPESPIIQRHLYEMVENGCDYAVIECSSHGLSKKLMRLDETLFDAAVFMNVTLEHLEFHKTFERYRDDKANLFRALDEHDHIKFLHCSVSGNDESGNRSCGENSTEKKIKVPSFGIVNLEDKSAEFFSKATTKKVYGFATRAAPVPDGVEYLVAEKINATDKELSFELDTSAFVERTEASDSGGSHSGNTAATTTTKKTSVHTNLNGSFNAYNVMAALIAVQRLTALPLEVLAKKAEALKPITGRMTTVDCGQPFEVIADYAHTPSSFEIIFPPLRERCKGKITALFGSGGERDLTKRPLQGEVAAKYCDAVILCDEDPRGEPPMKILEDIAVGAERGGMVRGKNLLLIPDRNEAIKTAVKNAQSGDIVLLLGKGHENTIIYADGAVPYDEIAAAKKALNELGYKK